MKGMRTGLWCGALLAPALIAAGCSGAAASFAPGEHEAVESEGGSQDTDGTGSTTPDATLGADGRTVNDATTVEAEAEAQVAPSRCDGFAVCDDFESETIGMPPKASLWAITSVACGPDRGTVTVDATHAHSGQKAVKVVNDFGPDAGPPGYCDHVFFSNLSAFATAVPQQVYVRFYMYMGDPVTMGHVTFATMTDRNDSSSNKQLRLGLNGGVFVWNRESDNAYLPELDTGNGQIDVQTSDSPTAQTWSCIEIHVDEVAGALEAWVDGNSVDPSAVDASPGDGGNVLGLDEYGTPIPNVSTIWLGQGNSAWHPFLTDFGLGWETYNNLASDAMVVWYDDVAIASTRIGCLP